MLMEILSLFLLILILFSLYMKRLYTYWERKNIPCVPATFPYGSLKDVIQFRKTVGELMIEYYQKFDDCKVVGLYSPFKRFLIIRDPELIKTVVVQGFNNFHQSAFDLDNSYDPLFGNNPFLLKGFQDWKTMRNIHSPMHSATKMKSFLPDMATVATNFVKYLLENSNKPINISEVSNYYTADVVARCGYGIESNLFFKSEESIFKRCAMNMITDESSSKLIVLSSIFFPFLNKILRSRISSVQSENDFILLGRTCLELREKSGIVKNDLIQLLLAFNKKEISEKGKGMTDQKLAAHLFTLFLDGVLTSSVVLTFALHELAANQDIQNKLRDELQDINLEGPDYENLLANQYLDMVLSETLRLHTPVPILSRKCTKTTNIDGIKIVPGEKVFIPTCGLHNDPKYFPNPRKFDPERFSKNNKISLNKFTFLPFGEGPRICLGFRFGQTQIKMALASIVKKFRFTLPAGTPKEMAYGKGSIFLTVPKNDVNIIFTPI